jgi:glycosyltransferase involved in cell wall biosynthesis
VPAERGRLVVVSHPCVVDVNQLVYRELLQRGWDVTIVVPSRWRNEFRDAEFAPRPLPGLEDRLLPLPVALAGRPQRHVYRARLHPLLRRLCPDVLLVEQEPFSLAALQWSRAARSLGIPFGLQIAENRDRRQHAPARHYRTRLLRDAAFVAARSPRAASLVKTWGALGRVVFVPHAVPQWQGVPRRMNGVFTVGYAGRLVSEKGVEDLVEAVAKLDGPVRLLLVGDGPLRAELERREHPRMEVRKYVPHDRMGDAYAEMNVLVLPSRTTAHWTEQFGRVLVEALLCRVPVVGSDSGEIPWVIEQTGGGLTFPEGDVGALAAALGELRASPERADELARRGQEAVQRLFSIEAVADILDEVLLEARR